jgi:hypothetical protein
MAGPDHFLLQIVTPEGEHVRFRAGGLIEANLIEICTQQILSRGVGLFRTQAHVEQDIRAGLAAALYEFKRTTVLT